MAAQKKKQDGGKRAILQGMQTELGFLERISHLYTIYTPTAFFAARVRDPTAVIFPLALTSSRYSSSIDHGREVGIV